MKRTLLIITVIGLTIWLAACSPPAAPPVDNLFQFVPPEGATRLEMPGPDLGQNFTDLESLQAAAPIPVFTPSELPEGFTFQQGSIFSPGVQGDDVPLVMMDQFYLRKGKQLSIYQAQLPPGASPSLPMSDVEALQVRGYDAVYMEMGPGDRQVLWLEGDMQLGLSGQVEKEVLLQIAESLR